MVGLDFSLIVPAEAGEGCVGAGCASSVRMRRAIFDPRPFDFPVQGHVPRTR